jgi:hypothetical protein
MQNPAASPASEANESTTQAIELTGARWAFKHAMAARRRAAVESLPRISEKLLTYPHPSWPARRNSGEGCPHRRQVKAVWCGLSAVIARKRRVIVSGCVRLMPTPPFIMGGGWVPFGRWSDRWDGGAVARSPASAAEQEVAEDTVKIRHPRSGHLLFSQR